MKTFDLESAEIKGETYSKCTIVIDDQKRHAEVQKQARFRKKNETTFSFEYGVETKATVLNKTVEVQGISLVAFDEDSAKEIGRLLNAQSVASIKSEASLRAQEVTASFLSKRGEVIYFLSQYKANPRGALFSLDPELSGASPDPLSDYLTVAKGALSKELDSLIMAVEGYRNSFGNSAAERVYAFVYAVGEIQDSMLKGTDSTMADRLLNELRLQPASEANVAKTTEALFRGASPSLFSP
jgi:hypothetical protein